MMMCASTSLVWEGFNLPSDPSLAFSPAVRVIAGAALGLLFIKTAKAVLEQHEELKLDVDGR